MNKTVKVIITIVATLIIGAVLLVVGIMGCGIISAIAIPQFVKNKEKAEYKQMIEERIKDGTATEEVSTNQNQETTSIENIEHTSLILHDALNNAQVEYENAEGKKPEYFDDFVLADGEVQAPYTYSFSDLATEITKPDNESDLHTTSLKVDFNDGTKVMYYLQPDGVEMKDVEE